MERQRIFISSVQSEFQHERKQLAEYIRTDALLGKFFVPFIFEELPAINLSAQEAYLHEAEHCDIYLGIYGELYGNEEVLMFLQAALGFGAYVALAVLFMIAIFSIPHSAFGSEYDYTTQQLKQ